MLLPAADFLTYAEAVTLYQQLKDAGVDALVKTCGPPSFPFGDGMYYQLLIEETEAEAARALLVAFELARTTPPVPRCPRCGTPDPAPLAHPRWWQRLYYAGTVLHQCGSCHRVFPV
jgi:hypothetical protein